MKNTEHNIGREFEKIEKLIDIAGRERVFDIVRNAGWGSHQSPPLYVWKFACDQAMRENGTRMHDVK